MPTAARARNDKGRLTSSSKGSSQQGPSDLIDVHVALEVWLANCNANQLHPNVTLFGTNLERRSRHIPGRNDGAESRCIQSAAGARGRDVVVWVT